MEKKPKRYRRRLDPNYSKKFVSEQTHSVWKSRVDRLLKSEVGGTESVDDDLDQMELFEATNEDLIGTDRPSETSSDQCVQDTGITERIEFETSNVEIAEETEGNIQGRINSQDFKIPTLSKGNVGKESEAVNFIPNSHSYNIFNFEKVNGPVIQDNSCFLEDEKDTPNARLLIENRVMFDKSNITIGDVLEMISAFSCRFTLALEGRLKLFEMFRICAGSEFDNLKISNYMFSKVYDPPDDKIKLHFYCSLCESPVLETNREAFATENIKKVICANCSKPDDLTLGSSIYFSSIDLQHQIKQLLHNPEVVRAFVNKIESRKSEQFSDKICDVHDGKLYRNVIEAHPNAIIYAAATDGATAKNPLKCKTGFWPLQLMFHDLPLSIRFKFIVLAGIMIRRKEPSSKLLNLFLNSFVEQAAALSEIDISIMLDDITHIFRFICLLSSDDSPARALLQNRIKHSGYFSCSYCYIKGFYANGAVRFPCESNPSPLRSAASHSEDLKNISQSSSYEVSRGVKGESVLLTLRFFDIVWSFAFDYLHTVLLGPVASVVTPEYHFSKSIINKIDSRLMEVRPSHEIYTAPQKLSERSAWKGNDYKSWLLYYFVPMCIDLLPENILQNFALLVKSMYTLLKTEITHDELIQCQADLEKYVEGFQKLYSIGSMTFNVHMIKHMVQSIVCSGPIALTSTFPFESNIGFLKNAVIGTKNIGLQIAIKSMQTMSYRCKARDFSTSPVAKIFCDSLFQEKKYTLSAQIKNGITFFGKPIISNEQNILGAKIYNKCIYKKQTYHSVHYNRSSKFNDTIIQLKCNFIAQILQIIDMPNDGHCYFRVWKLESKNLVVGDIEMPHKWEVTGNLEEIIVHIENVATKIILLEFENKKFACKPPNIIESS